MRGTAAILAAALLFAGCAGGTEGEGPSPRPELPVVETARGGPVTLTVRLSAREIGLADSLLLQEEVWAEPGFTAELPEFVPDEFEGFGITAEEEDPPERTKTGTVLRRRLTLEPERSGKLEIPAREAWFTRADGGGESSVTVKPIPVTVKPIEDPEAAALPDPRPALSARAEGKARGPSPWWLLLALPPLLAAGVLAARRRARPAPPRPAGEIAWEALSRLAAAGLVEKGEVTRFVVALSAILREYVERRFGVRAPERTTEEFLAEAAAHPRLAAHRAALEGFLRLADRVKFARYEPREEDLQEMFDAVKAFVAATEGPDV